MVELDADTRAALIETLEEGQAVLRRLMDNSQVFRHISWQMVGRIMALYDRQQRLLAWLKAEEG